MTSTTEITLVRGADGLTLTTYGSSTCPLLITQVESVDAETGQLTLGFKDAKACSADMKPHTELVQVPAGVDADGWTTVVVLRPKRDAVRVTIT